MTIQQAQRQLAVQILGMLDYQAAWELQRHLVSQRSADSIPDTLVLLEHPSTYTIGRSGGHEHLLVSPESLQQRGAALIEVDRGGDITYHGPGQLVGYPILQIRDHGRDLHQYLRMLEAVIIELLAEYGLSARRFPGYTGVWVGDRKIAAIGVRSNTRGVTSHGFALNVTTNLADFAAIVPCGIHDYGVTSLAELLPVAPALSDVQQRVIRIFARIFDLNLLEPA